MGANQMRKIIEKIICKAACTAAKEMTKKNVNSTCTLLSYQPEIPKEAKKLKRYE